jgi:hypothetical protein
MVNAGHIKPELQDYIASHSSPPDSVLQELPRETAVRFPRQAHMQAGAGAGNHRVVPGGAHVRPGVHRPRSPRAARHQLSASSPPSSPEPGKYYGKRQHDGERQSGNVSLSGIPSLSSRATAAFRAGS